MVLLIIYIVSDSVCFYTVNDYNGCSTSRHLGQCYNGLDLLEPEANNNQRVTGCGKTRCIAHFPCNNTDLFLCHPVIYATNIMCTAEFSCNDRSNESSGQWTRYCQSSTSRTCVIAVNQSL